MSYTDLRDFEAEYTVDVPPVRSGDDRALVIEIEKSGGGVGRAYSGRWRYIVTYADHVIAKGQDLTSGTLHTHAEMARVLADHLAHGERSGGRDCGELPLLERLCLFADDDGNE